MKSEVFVTEALGKSIEAVLCDTGSGISVTIAGGDLGHIGALSARYDGCEPVRIQFPSHREGQVCEKWAEALYRNFHCPVVVSCGVHYDDASKGEISVILDALDKLLDKIIKDLQNQ